MEKLFSTTLLFLFAFNLQAQNNDEVIRLSEPVQITDHYEVFGSEMDIESTSINPVSLSNLIENIERTANPVYIKTSVAQVCQKKGCFFIAQDGDKTARVTFKDYGFFIPTNSQGKEVILKGDFSENILSEEQAKHYAEDMGSSGDEIEGTVKEYSIIATSILVPKSN